MSKRVDQLAGKIATAMLARTGVAKSAGSVAQVMPYAIADAMAVVACEKALKRTVREIGRHVAHMDRLVDQNSERITRLAESYRASMAPPVAERGFADLTPDRFGVGLVEKQAPPRMNGHGSHGQGADPQAPPPWHPERGALPPEDLD